MTELIWFGGKTEETKIIEHNRKQLIKHLKLSDYFQLPLKEDIMTQNFILLTFLKVVNLIC